ncbi:hypothetical protein NECAME_03719 [Necator americanus]|uniref:Uncharacterized protein n=1 Tax=Necator americanus TaxID=51031 RepID=W2T1T1_NECAM|nr:hypothetical protein NECAME_03719 [Necator americanus]ETN75529.1 hypothetical protein NECAME_03719 [Necator americanus]
MLKLARGSSNFSVSSVDYDLPLKPKKEAQKRKLMRSYNSLWFSVLYVNVHFDDEHDIFEAERYTMSTATFLRQKGLAWNSLAQAFGCEEDIIKDDAMVMNELLNLCSFWADSEPIFEGVDEPSSDDQDSDDEDLECLRRLAMFSSSVSTVPPSNAHCSSTSSGLSSLRLNSLLRLSTQCCRSSTNSSMDVNRLSCTPSSDSLLGCEPVSVKPRSICMGELESAFKGIVNDDNEVSQDPVYVSTSASDDFWSQVEF